jgi:phosphopantetheinyl transferase
MKKTEDSSPRGTQATSESPDASTPLDTLPPLKAGTAHVVVGELGNPGDPAVLLGWLSEEEKARARAFRFDRDRNRFVLGRGMLRALLGHYLGIAPFRIELQASENGKPLAPAADSAGIAFNASRSHDLAVCAFCVAPQVGVDVERVRSDMDVLSLAASVFSEQDLAALSSLPPAERAPLFFDLWTRKEAAAKAEGTGLGADLADVDHRWSLAPLELPEGYAGHIATAQPLEGVLMFRFADLKLAPG